MAQLWEQIGENLRFIGICALIVAALYALARLAERFLPQRRRVSVATRVSMIGLFAAISTVLHLLDFPLVFLAPDFYKVDFSEVSVLICGFYLGPSAAVVCEGLKIVLKLLIKGTSTAFVGDFANFAVGCSFVLPAVIVYHTHKTRGWAIAALAIGTAVLTVFGSAFNAVYLLPKFAQLYGVSLDTLVSMGTAVNSRVNSVSTLVLLCVAPLNLLKGSCVSLLTFLLYKRIANLLK
ncbi:MAG: ECF transporter S component [Firmicutes bacterium]|nr:ECF transporter S component [Bacillota bacterium]